MRFGSKERFAVASSFVAAGQALVFDFQGAADRLQEVAQWVGALAPVIGVGLTAFGGGLLAWDGPRAYRWLRDRTPANRFGADEHQFRELYERWSHLEEFSEKRNVLTEDRYLLIEDTNVLLKKHRIPPPEDTDPDIFWKAVMRVSLGASKGRDLKRARKKSAAVTDWARGD